MKNENTVAKYFNPTTPEYRQLHLTIQKLANKWMKGTEQHREDIVAAGWIGAADALSKFDETRGIKFTTFAHMFIIGAMRGEKEDYCGYAFNMFNSKDDDVNSFVYETSAAYDNVSDLEANIDAERLIAKLDERAQKIMSLYADGYRGNEIHRMLTRDDGLKISAERVRQIIKESKLVMKAVS